MTTATRPTKPRINYPRPPLVRDHRVLFREPTYQDGQPYSDGMDDGPEDEGA
ncbi:hypothetical protein AB0R01_30305 [Streptomyces rochei]|uniref:hypothetical protein n=1 Tax=Streptomyces rochei TaxID=1928 RepID=UPI0034361EEF